MWYSAATYEAGTHNSRRKELAKLVFVLSLLRKWRPLRGRKEDMGKVGVRSTPQDFRLPRRTVTALAGAAPYHVT